MDGCDRGSLSATELTAATQVWRGRAGRQGPADRRKEGGRLKPWIAQLLQVTTPRRPQGNLARRLIAAIRDNDERKVE